MSSQPDTELSESNPEQRETSSYPTENADGDRTSSSVSRRAALGLLGLGGIGLLSSPTGKPRRSTIDSTTFEPIFPPRDEFFIPFGSFSFTNIEQVHSSITLHFDETSPLGETISLRFFDVTSDSPVPNSEIQIHADTRDIDLDAPMIPIDANETRRLDIEAKISDGFGFIFHLTVYVWDEIA